MRLLVYFVFLVLVGCSLTEEQQKRPLEKRQNHRWPLYSASICYYLRKLSYSRPLQR